MLPPGGGSYLSCHVRADRRLSECDRGASSLGTTKDSLQATLGVESTGYAYRRDSQLNILGPSSIVTNVKSKAPSRKELARM